MDKDVTLAEFEEESTCKVELWNYSPKLLAKEKSVDKLSLYLSLKDSSDERVQDARKELLKDVF